MAKSRSGDRRVNAGAVRLPRFAVSVFRADGNDLLLVLFLPAHEVVIVSACSRCRRGDRADAEDDADGRVEATATTAATATATAARRRREAARSRAARPCAAA